MQTLRDADELRAWRAELRASGESLAFVPTMGNLHDGHLHLVEVARERATRSIVSIFVNPMQFGAGEDFERYPRTEGADAARLVDAGADALFLPGVRTLYPHGPGDQTRVEVPGISDIHCGAARPGHFVGVATVVLKLFNLVQPDIAVFGRKDFQQLLVIRRMVADLNLPLEIVGVPTVREADGLAMSSRNGYLDADQRKRAAGLYATLVMARERVLAGDPIAEIERNAAAGLAVGGFVPEYLRVCDATTLAPAGADTRDLVILAAARMGATRLIDNLEFTRGDQAATAVPGR
ncbi:MAG: pantoate--beta-alanine ligase [Chromatiales bacterium]|nr:pantoate--beta-alanine ligase [Chromatiales bacterium]